MAEADTHNSIMLLKSDGTGEEYGNNASGGGGSGGGSTDLGESCTTVFNTDGSITQTYSDRIKNTVFNADGSITESLSTLDSTVYETKTTTFNADGSISETVTNI